MARGFYGRTGIVIKDTLTPYLEELPALVLESANNAALAGGEIIRQHAHDNANVSSGERGHARDGRHMRDCIDVTLVDKPGLAANVRISIDPENVPYAVHQEFGPNGNRFMSRAIDESRDEVHAAMQESLAADAVTGFKTQVRFRGVA